MAKTDEQTNNITINYDTDRVGKIMTDFILQWAPQIVQNITGKINQEFQEGADPSLELVEREDGGFTFELREIASNKGTVLVSSEKGNLETVEYADLEVGEKYLTYDKEFFFVFVKTEDGELDSRIAYFNGLTQAVDAFDEVPTELPKAAVAEEVEGKDVKEATMVVAN